MKLLFLLVVLIPIASFLKFILLDILDDLVASKAKTKKVKVQVVSNEPLMYKQAQ